MLYVLKPDAIKVKYKFVFHDAGFIDGVIESVSENEYVVNSLN